MQVVLTVYPLILYPMRVGCEFTCAKVGMTIGAVIGSLVLSLFLSELDVVNKIGGVTSAFVFLTLFPGLMGKRGDLSNEAEEHPDGGC